MLKVGIVGGTGYMGGEALRVLLDHPEVELKWVTSRQNGTIADFHPNLFGLDIKVIHPDDTDACDLVFLALPTSAIMETASRFLKLGGKVIDLGAAFRLSDRSIWESVYGHPHTHWHLVEKAAYGIPELHLKEIKQASLIANPGCFASAAILGLAPLIKEKLIEPGKIVVEGLSGTAGAGAELARAAHHPEIGNNLVPYNVVNHRHTFEMEQELSLLTENEVTIHFTPVYVPIIRGILDICHGFSTRKANRDSLLELYRHFYKDEPFVKIYDLPFEQNASWQYKPYPWVNSVAGTNYCFIGLDVDEKRGRIVVFSVLDSIGKGGAQVGVENMNLMFGFDRTLGLKKRGLHPM